MQLSASAALAVVAICTGQALSQCHIMGSNEGNYAVRDSDCKQVGGTQDTLCWSNMAKVSHTPDSVVVESHRLPIWVSIYCTTNTTLGVDVACTPASRHTYPLDCPHNGPISVDTLNKL
ncbi:hypothetical protein E4U42_002317 [Claviceps africana]|uniref:Uncharacterized protein n=1 Tax=Claviceps africana TaxID=83212 RepID=A0A8K0J9M7_9HYPO|nr:hypothetical protein E4U42_002317 [Claviceps africana]